MQENVRSLLILRDLVTEEERVLVGELCKILFHAL